VSNLLSTFIILSTTTKNKAMNVISTVVIKKETEKAVLVEDFQTLFQGSWVSFSECWLPKSKVEFTDRTVIDSVTYATVTIPAWLAKNLNQSKATDSIFATNAASLVVVPDIVEFTKYILGTVVAPAELGYAVKVVNIPSNLKKDLNTVESTVAKNITQVLSSRIECFIEDTKTCAEYKSDNKYTYRPKEEILVDANSCLAYVTGQSEEINERAKGMLGRFIRTTFALYSLD
jgi:hypothetical protein